MKKKQPTKKTCPFGRYYLQDEFNQSETEPVECNPKTCPLWISEGEMYTTEGLRAQGMCSFKAAGLKKL